MKFLQLSLIAVLILVCMAFAQVADALDEIEAGIPVNYTEAKVGSLYSPIH